MPQLTLNLSKGSPLSGRILEAVNDRHDVSSKRMENLHSRWKASEERFNAYIPERDVDAERRIARDNKGELTYRTIMLPYSYAQLMSAHTYWTTVFLGRAPVFQFEGRHGEAVMQTQAMEALIDYQRQVGGWLPPLYIWLLDVGKYGVGIIGNYWAEEDAYVSEIVSEENLILGQINSGEVTKRRVTRRIPGYRGSRLYNVRPYHWYPDPRVPMHRFQDGEFCGVYGEVGWNEILRREASGEYVNIENLKRGPQVDLKVQKHQRQMHGHETEVPDPSEDWIEQTGGHEHRLSKRGANFWGLYEYYIELVPADWGLGQSKFPEKWVFTTNANREVLVGARPLGAIHNKFPFDVLEYEPEAYTLVNRSLMEVLQPIQDTMDWLINSHFYNVRKVLNDQLIVDPSRVVMKDVMSDDPGLTIRLKPTAYGTDVRTVMSQLPVQDVTRAHLSDLQLMNEFGQRMTGVNDSVMGQLLTQGGRRTASEVRSSNTFSVGRLKTISEWFSTTGFDPLAMKLTQNSQQYYDDDRKFRIVGDLVQEAGPQFVQVTPENIAGFYDFVPVDGTMPVDRFAQANLWRALFADVTRVPAIAQNYDLAKIFGWVAKLAGLKNINQFRVQVMPDQQLQDEAQRGNVVPIPQGGSSLQIEGQGSTF